MKLTLVAAAALLAVSLSAPAHAGTSCKSLDAMPTDGSVEVLEHLAGEDDLGFDVKDGKAKLRVGGVQSGGTLKIRVRGKYEDVTVGDSTQCVAVTNLVFVFGRLKDPKVGTPIAYSYKGEAGDSNVTKENPNRIFIDLNEKKTAVSAGAATVEYSGVSGTLEFTALNAPDEEDPGSHFHDLKFSIVFEQVGGKAKTRASGTLRFSTMRQM